jgi:hypothetical protein
LPYFLQTHTPTLEQVYLLKKNTRVIWNFRRLNLDTFKKRMGRSTNIVIVSMRFTQPARHLAPVRE